MKMCLAIVLSLLFTVPSAAYEDAFQTAHQKEVYNAFSHFFGNLRGSYIQSSRLVWEQVGDGISGPTNVTLLADGNYLWFGCRLHSCDEKAAIVLTPAVAVKGVGLVNFHCTYGHSAKCSHEAILTVFVKGKDDHSEAEQDLQAWAKREAQVTNMEIKPVP